MTTANNVATVTLAKRWGRGYKRIVCDVSMSISDYCSNTRFYACTDVNDVVNVVLVVVGDDVTPFASVLANSTHAINRQVGANWFVMDINIATETTKGGE